MAWFRRIFKLLLDRSKQLFRIMTKRICPFCGSEDVFSSIDCSFEDHTRSSTRTTSGVFMSTAKAAWDCRDCGKTFISTQ